MQLPKTVEIIGEGFACRYVLDIFNMRVRMDDYSGNVTLAIDEAIVASIKHQCGKLIVKARTGDSELLLGRGFVQEGMINRYFNGSDMHFYCRYFSSERRNSDWWAEEDEVLEKILKSEKGKKQGLPSSFELKACTQNDVEQLAVLYKEVFKIYPVPLSEASYIKKCMDEGTMFQACFMDGKIIGAASAEVNGIFENAEITDCATLPDYRQYGLMQQLLSRLEDILYDKQIFCLYTIARAKSYGMNAVFHKLDYEYKGRLANNCVISEGLEDMNVWVKDISAEK